jgi:quinol-cytochrome oxidoreductase complex cytochrome b subunit
MQKAVNVLGWLGVVSVIVSLVLRFQTWRLEWQPYSWWAAMIGLVLILVYMAGQWREIAQPSRSGTRGSGRSR